MALIFHDWSKFTFFILIAGVCSFGLYFFWYRNLTPDDVSDAEDALFDDLPFGELPPLPR